MKRLFTILLCIIMIASFIPSSAFAYGGRIEIGSAASIGGTEYDAFGEAVRCCGENDVIDLLADIGEFTLTKGNCFSVRRNGFDLVVLAPEGETVEEIDKGNGVITYHNCVANVEYEWSDNYLECEARQLCTKFTSYIIKEETGTVTYENTPVSCTEDGEEVYTARFDTIDSDEKVFTTPSTGHKFENHRCSKCEEMEEGYTDSGECGDNAIWSIDDEGTLQISGTGAVDGNAFSDYNEKIIAVTIEDGISKIGEDTFKDFTLLNEVTLPSTIERISAGTFDGCTKLAVIKCDVSEEDWNRVTVECTIPDSAVIKLLARLTIQIGSGSNTVQINEQATVTVSDSDGREYAIGTEVKLESGAVNIASVSGDEVVGKSVGQTNITATIVNDKYNRSVSTVVNVVGSKSDAEGFYIVDQTDGKQYGDEAVTEFYLDKDECAAAQKAYIIGTKTDGNKKIEPDGLTYSSTDSKVAKLSKISKGEYKNCYLMTIPKGASGSCTVTASYTNKKDTSKSYSLSMAVNVMDYTPRIESAKLTLNPNLSSGVSTALISSFGNEIEAISGIYEKVGKTYSEEVSDRLTAEYANGVLTIKPTEELKNQTINAKLAVEGTVEKSELFLTISVKNSMPKVTVKQISKLNLYLKDEAKAEFTFDAKDATVSGVEFITGCSFDGEYENGVFSVSDNGNRDAKGKLVNGSVEITFDGYTKSATQKLAVSTESKAPSLKLSKSTLTINKNYPQVGDYAAAVISEGILSVDSWEIGEVVTKGKSPNEAIECTYTDGRIYVSVKNSSLLIKGKYTYQFAATLSDGSVIKPVKFTVSVVDAKATAALKASGKMDLTDRNRSGIEYAVTLKNVNTEVVGVRLLDAKTKTAVDMFNAEVLDGSIIRLTFNDTAYALTSYKFIPEITIKTGDEKTESILCSAQTVKLTQSALKVAAPSAQMVYQSNSERVLTYKVNVSSPAGASIKQVAIGKPDILFTKSLAEAASNISFFLSKDRTALTVRVTLKDTSKLVAGKTYTLPLVITPEGALNSKADAGVKLSLKVQK